MKKSISTKVVGVMIVALFLMAIGCSEDEKPEQTGLVNQIIDDAAEQFVEEVVSASFAMAPFEEEISPDGIFGVNDILVFDSVMYAVYDDGIISYNFRTGVSFAIGTGEVFRAVTLYEENVFVGGDNLYRVVNLALEPVKAEIKGQVRALDSYEHRLIIGTDCGLYSHSAFGNELLFDDIKVSALVTDRDGLWVGSDGDGLYRWDGDEFQRRYLVRDTTIFDNIHALDFNRDYLYVGAETGLFIFDGGSWDQWTVEMGLPSDMIRSIDASGWTVYLATDKGIISYFDNNLYPVRRLEERSGRVIRSFDRKLIVGTEQDGILLKAGSAVTTLIEPIEKRDEAIFSKTEEEVIQ